ncbi:MAG: hypothetical protein WC667_09080 [Sulfurimonas sp.]|jgi:hypothetical protein
MKYPKIVDVGLYSTWNLLWPKSVKEGVLDFENKKFISEKYVLKIEKVSNFQVITLKYVMPLLFLVGFMNWGDYFVSQIAFAGAALVYMMWSSIYRYFGRKALLLSILPFPLIYLYLSSNAIIPDYRFHGMSGFNSAMIYFVGFWLFEYIYTNYMRGAYANYWSAKGGREKIYLEVLTNTKPHYLTYVMLNGLLAVFVAYGATGGYKGYQKSLESEKIVLDHEAKIQAIRDMTKKQTADEKKLKLDTQAASLGVANYHETIDGIIGYEAVDVTPGTVYVNLDNNVSTKYNGEGVKAVAFIKGNHWFLIGKNQLFEIISATAR